MSQDEEIILVDETDKITGYKWRSQQTDDDCWRIVSVWVENSAGQVLLQQRSFDKKISPGKWTPAADGTVEKDTSYDETAERELEEEVGLAGVTLTKMNKVHAKYELGWRQVQGYKVVCDWPLERFTPQKSEVAQLEWADKQQVLDEITGKAPHSRLWPDSCGYWPELFDLES